MPALSLGEIAVWLVTTGVVVAIPVAIVLLAFRLGRRSAAASPEGREDRA